MKKRLFPACAAATLLAATSCSNGAVTLQTSSVDDVVKAMTKGAVQIGTDLTTRRGELNEKKL